MNRYVYIGFSEKDDSPFLAISQERLAPAGTRLLRGEQFPAEVTAFYNLPLSEGSARTAVKALEAFLRGENVTTAAPVFGEATGAKKRKRTTI